jgi:hypothetical protein
MALTSQQIADVRRYAGYPAQGDQLFDDSRDVAYGWISPGVWQTLYHRLNSLSTAEEGILANTYLTNLYSLESALAGSGADLDTASAGPWTRNPGEIAERAALFDNWRRRMCWFIGIAPGPSLGPGGTASRIRRC